MLQALFDFFFNIFNQPNSTGIGYIYRTTNITIFGTSMTFPQYLTITCSLISLVFIIVLCCLFIKKMVNIVGNLTR